MTMKSEDIRDAVFQKRPYLRAVYDSFGSQTLSEYAKENLKWGEKVLDVHEFKKNREAIRAATHEAVSAVLEKEVADEVDSYLKTCGYISTVDHHGPMTDPSFVHGNILQGLVNKESGKKVVLVFSAGGISLDNDSFPRGLSHEGESKRLHILSLHDRHQSVLAAKPYSQEQIEKFIEKAETTFPKMPFREIYGSKKALSFKTYSEQITYTNYHLFRCLPEFSDMHFVIIPIEIITSKILALPDISEKEIGKIIFNTQWREKYLKETDGISVAHTNASRKGTELFWHLKDGVREQLFVRGDRLATFTESFSIPLEPKDISEALKYKEIYPSSALCLTLLAFYSGYVCGGGDGQVNYHTELSRAYLRLLDSMGETKRKTEAEKIPADRWGGDFLFFYQKGSDAPYALSFLDIINGGEKLWKFISERIHDTTLASAIDNVLPDTYHTIFGERFPHTPNRKNIFHA